MRKDLASRGWVFIQNPTADQLQRGDILVCDDYHTEFYIDHSELGAHHNEIRGGASRKDAKTGDQTGEEISEANYDFWRQCTDKATDSRTRNRIRGVLRLKGAN